MYQCIMCKNDFQTTRKTAKFCSPLCRKRYNRSVTENPLIVAQKELSVTDSTLSVTKNEVSVTTPVPVKVEKPMRLCPRHHVVYCGCNF